MRLVVFFLLFALRLLPCSCGGTVRSYCVSPPNPTFPDSAIFLGTVEAIEVIPLPNPIPTGVGVWGLPLDDRKIKFRVDESFLGAKEPEFQLDNGGSGFGADCSVAFKLGGQYLVQASKSKGVWTTSVCLGTSRAIDQPYIVAALRAWKSGTQAPLAIHGKVEGGRPEDAIPKTERPIPIHLKGAGIDLDTTTDSEGYFAFLNLAPGIYEISANRPGTRRVDLTKSLCGSELLIIRE